MAFRCSNPLLVMGVEMTASAKQNDTPRTALESLLEQVIHGDFCADNPKDLKLAISAREELTAARAEAEAWKIYAGHQENCAWCADSIDDCDEGQTLRDAAIDAARSTEGKK